MTDEPFTGYDQGGWLQPHFGIVRNDIERPEYVAGPTLAYHEWEPDDHPD